MRICTQNQHTQIYASQSRQSIEIVTDCQRTKQFGSRVPVPLSVISARKHTQYGASGAPSQLMIEQ
jgi:hypothetical protein